MAKNISSQSEHTHCAGCLKLKEESCAEVKKSLEQCAQAHEDARLEKEQAAAKELKEAKAKINKLQKTLSAFQLVTTVGVTIVGQEAFDKIFNKVEQVQNVQAKITETIPTEKKQTTQTPKEPEKISNSISNKEKRIDFTSLLQQFESLDRINQAKIQITKAEVSNTPWIPEDTTVSGDANTSGKLIIDPPVVPPISVASVTNYNFPLIVMGIPNSLPVIQYSLLPFQDSPFVFGQFETSVIPEFKYTGSISLLGAAAYASPRRRNV